MDGALVVQSIPSRSPETTFPPRGDPGGQEVVKIAKNALFVKITETGFARKVGVKKNLSFSTK